VGIGLFKNGLRMQTCTEPRGGNPVALPQCGDAPELTNLMDAFRIVLRASPSAIMEPAANMPSGIAPAPEPVPGPADPPRIQTSSGTPVAVAHSRSFRALRRAKPASELRPGDAIRLETGERVVITYASAGFASTHRYIEWRGPLISNWANVPLDGEIMLS
jgi:hypothetical protein